jgi:hypothetical protein
MQMSVHAVESIVHTVKTPEPIENPLAVPAQSSGSHDPGFTMSAWKIAASYSGYTASPEAVEIGLIL